MQQHKTPHQPTQKAKHPTLLGTIFFTVFNLILLSLVAWFLLEAWFLIINGSNGEYFTERIIKNNLSIIQNNHCISIAFAKLQNIKSVVYAINNGHIGGNIINIFLNVIEIIFTRICIFVEWIPLMMLMLFVLAIDGLVLRDKRKFQGARESTFVFHRLKPIAKLFFFTLFLIYMASPFSISPLLFLFPMTFVSSLFVSLTIKNFKKYL